MAHEDRAHVGAKRTYEYLRQHVFMPRLWKKVKAYTATCEKCRKAKPDYDQPLDLIVPTRPPPTQLSTQCIDFITSLPECPEGTTPS